MDTIDALIFEPVARHATGGSELQIAMTKYKGISIHERTFIPWSPFKNISVLYMVDLVFPMGTLPFMSDKYYTEDGYGVPEVKTLEEAIQIIDDFKNKQIA